MPVRIVWARLVFQHNRGEPGSGVQEERCEDESSPIEYRPKECMHRPVPPERARHCVSNVCRYDSDEWSW